MLGSLAATPQHLHALVYGWPPVRSIARGNPSYHTYRGEAVPR
jgi:hypothetical protein